MAETPLTLIDVNSRSKPCMQCRSEFRVALPSERRDQTDLASLAREPVRRTKFVQILREVTRCDLRDAKGVLHHVTTRPGKCHRCDADLPLEQLVDCRSCGALNIQLDGEAIVLPCPACGFLVVAGSYGTYEICAVCGWEDDGVQLANPTSGGGANRESLVEAQATALRQIPLGTAHPRFNRSKNWRPLFDFEIAVFAKQKAASHWYAKAVVHEGEAYWASAELDRNGV
jgi:hypothetical protein